MNRESRLSKKHLVPIIVTFFGYIVIALYFNSLGPNAPVIMDFYGTSYAQHGFLMTMQSVGALAAAIFFSLRGEHYNKINMIAAGILLFGVSSLAAGFTPPYAALVFILMLCGAGATTTDVMLNGMIPELYPKHKNTLLPILHAFFGVGAMITPLIVTVMVNPDIPLTFGRPLLLFGALGILVSLVFFIASRRTLAETPYVDMDAVRKKISDNPADFYKEKKAWMFLAAAVLYFSFQLGLLSWLPSYCREIGMDFNTAGTMLTAFFTGSLVMRFCGALILKKITARKAYIMFSLLSAVIVAAALFMTSPSVMLPLLAVGGFLQGSCVAFLLLMSTAEFPDRVASASSLTFIGLSLAAMVTPLWMGALAEFTGFLTPLLMVCALLALSGLLVIKATKPPGR